MIIIINPLHMAPDMLLLGPNLEVLTPNFGPILKGFSCSSSMYTRMRLGSHYTDLLQPHMKKKLLD